MELTLSLSLASAQTPLSTSIASWFYALVALPSLTNPWRSWIGKTALSETWSKRPAALTSCTNAHKRRTALPNSSSSSDPKMLEDRTPTGTRSSRVSFSSHPCYASSTSFENISFST